MSGEILSRGDFVRQSLGHYHPFLGVRPMHCNNHNR